MNAPATTHKPLVCPLCQAAVQRVPRRPADRLLSLFHPVWRFRCAAPACGWEDRVRRDAEGSTRGRLGSYYSDRPVLEASRGASAAARLKGA
ncbi:hypothetical protein [Rubrivivax sp. A210]|uniref:hypothetical protein n=1 Tax=Rubrivivax sp. A210 TaxID=2772301 RepID=UPI00191A1848|nr:hypothetical protein [Rubrivivax sp. A210]